MNSQSAYCTSSTKSKAHFITASLLLTASLGEVRGFGETERRRREPTRGAAGAEGDGAWEGVSSSPLGEGPRKGTVPLPRKFFPIFGVQITTFGALWGLFLRFSGLFWTLHDSIMSVTGVIAGS